MERKQVFTGDNRIPVPELRRTRQSVQGLVPVVHQRVVPTLLEGEDRAVLTDTPLFEFQILLEERLRRSAPFSSKVESCEFP